MKAGNRRRENVRVRGGASSRSFVLRSRHTLRRILSPVSDLSVESSPFDYPPPGTPQARSVSRQSRVAAGTDRFFSLVFTTVLFSLSLSLDVCACPESPFVAADGYYIAAVAGGTTAAAAAATTTGYYRDTTALLCSSGSRVSLSLFFEHGVRSVMCDARSGGVLRVSSRVHLVALHASTDGSPPCGKCVASRMWDV